jgi:hypothetical protein
MIIFLVLPVSDNNKELSILFDLLFDVFEVRMNESMCLILCSCIARFIVGEFRKIVPRLTLCSVPQDNPITMAFVDKCCPKIVDMCV